MDKSKKTLGFLAADMALELNLLVFSTERKAREEVANMIKKMKAMYLNISEVAVAKKRPKKQSQPQKEVRSD
jgi:hypothetical protein